jgi:hypothetical protein
LTNTILTLTGNVWNVSSTNFSITHTNGRINLNNAGTTVFTGGGKNYNELRLNSGPVTIINNAKYFIFIFLVCKILCFPKLPPLLFLNWFTFRKWIIPK